MKAKARCRLLFILALAAAPASQAQPAARAGPCAPSPVPGQDWKAVTLAGLGLALRLPSDLRERPQGALKNVARSTRRRSIPAAGTATVELAAAWEAPRASPSEIREVLLFVTRPDSVPVGRPCAIRIAGSPGVAFRVALGAEGGTSDEFWVEAYWPGFVLAAGGRSFEAYGVIFAILRSITTTG